MVGKDRGQFHVRASTDATPVKPRRTRTIAFMEGLGGPLRAAQAVFNLWPESVQSRFAVGSAPSRTAPGALYREVLFHHLIGECVHRAGADDRSTIHNRERVGQFLAEIEVLLDEQDAHLGLAVE